MSAPGNIAMERAEWLACLCADRAVKLVPLRVGVIIANHINGKLGEAWPSQSTIAQRLGMEKYNVTKAVRELTGLGYLSVTKSKQSNRYRLRFPSVPPDTGQSISSDVSSDTVSAFRRDTSGVFGGTPDGYLVEPPICEETQLNSDGAAPEGASAHYSEPVWTRVPAGLPDGARHLHGRLESEIEDAFGRPLHAHERERFIDLVGQIGRPSVHDLIASYVEAVQSGATSRLSIARWLRRGGLMEVSNVA